MKLDGKKEIIQNMKSYLQLEVIKSPGIPDSIEIIQDLKSKGIPIISEVSLKTDILKLNIIAITGTNGKTTTTLLIGYTKRGWI